ncbi:NAD(P)-binding domain-containing protein [Haloterrigena sp. SYSU A558-1]|uniref:NAD(P)-binding domain-containing protein n=1 Tax=Haloterrigena gelatinilytica TaxID=2741724 RepID=A0ABX2LIH2_9EURY|nr:NAD(P)-binding domain-containing protein [Haloterrigena gelatinilytica]NUC72586.1 NAD(P)-binding domain-containing protein [Haloterrigena gelatinilytica]
MKIGIIGAGDVGSTAAQHFAEAGHEVMISNSRGPETLTDLVDDLGGNAHAGTVSEAADFGEVVMEAIPFNAYESLPADSLRDKIVISASNYYPMRDGFIDIGKTHTDLIADHLEDSRVVKAFNATYWKTLRDGQRLEADPDDRLAIFIAGDDDEAKSVVSSLIEDIGFTPVDTGPLTEGGRHIQPGSPIYTASLTASEARTRLAALKTTVAAYELGYYDSSREVTIQELADELDMNEESISEHLQQGTEQLISQYLD